MLVKVFIACDKFRGSLEGPQVSENLQVGIREIIPTAEFTTSLVADGGEGSLKALSLAYNTRPHKIQVHNAVGVKHTVEIGFNDESGIAVLEMAAYVGLAMLDNAERNPLETSTYGLGEAMKEASRLGVKKILIAIGGSSTNDGGAGALQALSYRFLDQQGTELSPVGGNLNHVHRILPPARNPLRGIHIVIASDVDNPICGPQGASFTYGLQKGAQPEELEFLDNNLRHYGELTMSMTGNDVFSKAGYGAAGGVAISLCEFLGAELRSGGQMFFDALRIEDEIMRADVVITGEGKIDRQTAHGKAISPIVDTALRLEKKLFLVCGIFENTGLDSLDSLTCFQLDEMARETNMDSFEDAPVLVQEAGRRIATLLQ